MRAVLNHLHGQNGQLFDLANSRLANRMVLPCTEHVAATTPLRSVLDHPIYCARRQQLTPVALMAGLAARLASGGILTTPPHRGRRIYARWLGAIARTAIQPPLELSDPLVLTSNPSFQPPDLLIHPQKHRHHGLTALAIDRLRLQALHNNGFDNARLCPPTQPNAYGFAAASVGCRTLEFGGAFGGFGQWRRVTAQSIWTR